MQHRNLGRSIAALFGIGVILFPPVRLVGANPIALSVTSVLRASQTQQMSAVVTGSPNSAVVWSLSPAAGTVSATGLYTAPTSITSVQAIQVLATSAASSTQSAGVWITLRPTVSMTMTPTQVSLRQALTQQFAVSETGVTGDTVVWTVNPAVGSISTSGLYAAPAAVVAAQTVVVTATSVADPNSSATASVSLQPPVSVSVAPASATLRNGQTQQFTPGVTNTTNATVNWSLSPVVGTISNGLYTAPAFISSSQSVTVTATSAADATKSATAQVTLQPTVAVSIGPASASLLASATQQFTPTVTGTSNLGVTYSLSPNVGTISTTGLYTAPASIAAVEQVIVVATSTADSTKSGQATVTLNPPPSAPPVTLPVEVMGLNGTMVSTVVTVPTVPAGSNTMQLRVHGVKFDAEASVQVNGSAWVPLNTATVTLLGNANAYGGIGGGFSTLDMTVPLPAGAIVAGNNTINFRFNGTDGRTSGFRVLSFNFLDPSGNSLVPSTAFVQDDPTTWQPLSTSATDIAAGQALWRGGALTVPTPSGPVAIQANCTSCHAQDGRDLKYFNYSNYSIVARSLFHGLTAQQGAQIASYIRSLAVINPGRPWNPPYQPGPGLDALPVNQWAAGAGLGAVLANDQEQMADVFPGGIQASAFAASGNSINPRQVRVTFQMMDWNEWLPSVHPMDAYGAAFVNSSYNATYQALRANLVAGNATVYTSPAVKTLYTAFADNRASFWAAINANRSTAGFYTTSSVAALYSSNLWGLVKNWELNNEFQLEGMAQAYFGPQANPRSWVGNFPFYSSPAISSFPAVDLKNGKQSSHDYVAFAWYHLQLILNDSNHDQIYQNPIDWPYVYGQINGMAALVPPATGLYYEWQLRGLEIENNGTGPDLKGVGWQWWVTNPFFQIQPAATVLTAQPPATQIALAEGYLTSWLATVGQFTPQQFYTGGWATAAQVPNPGLNNVSLNSRFIDAIWYSIPHYRSLGVNQTLINQFAAWAQTMWPLGNWSATTTATCAPVGGQLTCSTD